jgi:hypothetical protein
MTPLTLPICLYEKVLRGRETQKMLNGPSDCDQRSLQNKDAACTANKTELLGSQLGIQLLRKHPLQ